MNFKIGDIVVRRGNPACRKNRGGTVCDECFMVDGVVLQIKGIQFNDYLDFGKSGVCNTIKYFDPTKFVLKKYAWRKL